VRALDVKLARDLRRLWAQALAVALVLACGVATLILAIGAYRSLEETRRAYYERYRFADVFAAATRAPERVASELRGISGVAAVETRIVKLVLLDVPDMREPATGMAVSLPDRGEPAVNAIFLRRGRLPEPGAPAEAVVSEKFADAHGFAVGSRFHAILNGARTELIVVGIALSPEYVYAIGPGDLIPDDQRFGIIWMSEKALEPLFDLEGAFNSVGLRLLHGASRAAVMESVDRLLAPFGGTGSFGREDQLSNAFLDGELSQLSAMAKIIPPIFLVVSAFLINMILARLIALEREQIGLLKAVGYAGFAIGWHYIKLVMAIAAVGIIIGFAAGTWLGFGLTRLYSRFYSFPFLIFRWDADIYAIAAAVSLAAAVAGAVKAVRSAVSLAPAVAMHPPAPPAYKRLFRGAFARMRLASELTVMAFRDLIRWPVRAALTILGTSLAVALLVVALFSTDSIDFMIDVLFFRSDRQDASLSFVSERPVSVFDASRRLPGVLRAEPFRETSVIVRNGHYERRLSITGKPANADLSRVLDFDLQPVRLPETGLALSERVAWLLRARRGDIVEVEFLEDGRRRVNVPVTDVIQSYLGLMVFMDIDALNQLAGIAAWRGIDAALASRAAAPDAELLPAATVAGRFELQGDLADMATWLGTGRLELAPGRNASGWISVGGNLAIDLRNGRWMLEGRPRLAGVAPAGITAAGALDGDTVDGSVRLEGTDIPSLLAALRTTGIADTPADVVTAGTLEGAVAFTGTLADPSIRGRARIEGLVGRQLEVTTLDGLFAGRPLSQQLEFTADAPTAVIADQRLNDVKAAGTLQGTSVALSELSARQPDASGAITGRGTYDTRSGMYAVTLGGTDWQLLPTAEQPLAGRLNLSFEGAGTADAPRGTGTLAVSDAAWQDMALGMVDAKVELDGQTARIDARAPQFDATASGRVTIDAPYNAALTVNAGQLDLTRVLQGIETPTPVSGTAGLELRFDGPLETWRTGSATLDVTALDARAGNLALRLAVPARVRYERERVFIDSFEVDAGETRLSATGDLDAFEPARAGSGVLVTLTGEVAEVARAAAATGLTDVPIEGGTGPVALLARINGSLESPLVAADLELGPGSVALRDLPPVTGLVMRAHAENGWFELRESSASYEGAMVTATGRAPIAWVMPSAAGEPGRAVVHAKATNITAAILAPFVDPATAEQLEGVMDVTLDAASATPTLADLTGELRLDRLDVRIADLPLAQRGPTRIVARDGFARIEAWDWVGQGATLSLRGQVRLEDRQSAILANGLVDLRMLTPFVRDAGMTTAGRLEPRLSITGPLDDPRIDGDLTLTAGELRLADPRVIATGLTMRSVVNRTSARITTLTGTVNGGMLTGAGGVDYSPEQGLDVQLAMMIGGMALEMPEGLRSEVDADLGLAMKVLPEPAGRLTGTITVVRGAYREPLAVVGGILAGMRAQRLAAGTADAASPYLEALALDVSLVTDEDIIVNNNYGRFQIGGDLRLVGTAAAPSVTGRAELREGGQLFVGRNVYTINFGTIDFNNPTTIEPVVNIQATTRAGREEIEVQLTGPAENPTPTLSSPSNPELTEADRYSLLLTGRPFDELAPDDAAFVGTQVLGNFSGEVLGFAGRAIGLDTVRLGGPETSTLREDPIAVAAQVDPTTRLTFGKSIGPDLELTFSQSLRDGLGACAGAMPGCRRRSCSRC
jgi:putative ABC transport system permease protein